MLLKALDVADQLGVSLQTVWRLVDTGKLTAVRLTAHRRGWRFTQADVAACYERTCVVHPTLPDPLPSVEEILAAAIPAEPIPAVYFLISAGRIVYVGQTTDLYRRIADHRRVGKDFDAMSWIKVSPAVMSEVEARYIEALKPALNIATPHVPMRSDDLMRIVREL